MLARLSPFLLAALLSGCLSEDVDYAPAVEPPAETTVDTSNTEANPEIDDEAIAAIDAFIAEKNYDTSLPGWRTRMFKPPWQTFDASKDYYWNLLTNKGLIKLKFMPDVAPKHVTSTIYLSRAGFYDGLTFHRVMASFMAQGGCPYGKGTGGPGYQYGSETSPNVKHDRRGLLSMANAGQGTDGSQFFITFVPYPSLNGKHTIFGEVVEGMNVLDIFEEAPTNRRDNRPLKPLVIERATIEVSS